MSADTMTEPLDIGAIERMWASILGGPHREMHTAMAGRHITALLAEVKRLRALEPQWKAQPTTAGWYFTRTRETGNIYNPFEGGRCGLFRFDGYKGVFNPDDVDRGHWDVAPTFGDNHLSDYPGYEWAGPLGPPP